MPRISKVQKEKAQLIVDLKEQYNLEQDRFGHFKFENSAGKLYRIKIQKIVFRLEFKTSHGWCRLISGKFKECILLCGSTIKQIG